MSQQNILESAKQGNPDAIAILINRTLQSKGITAKVSRKNTCLRIMLESSEAPNQSSLVELIFNGIRKLDVVGVDTLQIFGRQVDDDFPVWNQTLTLKKSELSYSPKPSSDSSQEAIQNEKSFRVKRDGQELIASNIEELKAWVRDDKVSLSDYLYNPILRRWMYVKELAEIDSVVRLRESSKQAKQYNRMSFIFAGLGVLMLFLIPPIGVILLAIGVVLSIMYYVQRSGSNSKKSRVSAALLALFFGGLGFHFFYLGAWGWGLLSILFCWTYFPSIAALITGIRYLAMSDEEFERKVGKVKGAFGPIEF